MCCKILWWHRKLFLFLVSSYHLSSSKNLYPTNCYALDWVCDKWLSYHFHSMLSSLALDVIIFQALALVLTNEWHFRSDEMFCSRMTNCELSAHVYLLERVLLCVVRERMCNENCFHFTTFLTFSIFLFTLVIVLMSSLDSSVDMMSLELGINFPYNAINQPIHIN